MPSSLHELLVDMFRRQPSLAAELLSRSFGIDLPEFQWVRSAPVEFADLTPPEYRADAVVVLSVADTPVLGVVVEVQLRPDQAKRWSWPLYLVHLRARLRCPALLLVICVEERTAAWCATPIEIGQPGWALSPLVVGPGRVPVVTDPVVAGRTPELAVLSVMAHADHPDRGRILSAFIGALANLEQDRAWLYSDVVFAALPIAARRHLEALMSTETYEFQSEFMRNLVRKGLDQGRAEGRADGLATGEARAVLLVLSARGVGVSEADRERISQCRDLDQLEVWVSRAATVSSTDELFA